MYNERIYKYGNKIEDDFLWLIFNIEYRIGGACQKNYLKNDILLLDSEH